MAYLLRMAARRGRRPISVRDPCRRPQWRRSTARPWHRTANCDGRPRGGARGGVKSEALAILDAAQSAALRDQLLAELATMTSADRVANWARAALPAKNTLTASDAKLVEDAFEQLLSQLPPFGASPEAIAPTNDDALRVHAKALQQAATAQATVARSVPGQATTGIDKSVLAIAAPRRYRNRDHLRFVARQPCLICGRKPSDPHHLRHMQPVALGRKASDEFAVPLCRTHHRAAHRAGDERAWWKASGIDPIKAARKLWKETRGQEGRPRPNPVARANVSDAKKLACLTIVAVVPILIVCSAAIARTLS
jgi:hypothetical protein